MAFTPVNLLLALAWIAAALFFAFTIGKMVLARRNAEGAFQEWREHSPERLEGIDEARFRRAWLRVYGARGQLYLLAGGIVVALASPIVLGLLALVWRLGWNVAGKPTAFAEDTVLWGFYLFFGLILGSGGVGAIVARVYARNRPGTFEDELARVRSSNRS